MRYDTSMQGPYLLVNIREDLTIHSDPSRIKQIVAELRERGHTRIAIAFRPDTFTSSRLIAALVSCCQFMSRRDGELAVVANNERMQENFAILNVAHNDCLRIVHDESELA
jgi:anti-anti-sigma regulatory factor